MQHLYLTITPDFVYIPLDSRHWTMNYWTTTKCTIDTWKQLLSLSISLWTIYTEVWTLNNWTITKCIIYTWQLLLSLSMSLWTLYSKQWTLNYWTITKYTIHTWQLVLSSCISIYTVYSKQWTLINNWINHFYLTNSPEFVYIPLHSILWTTNVKLLNSN